MRKPQQHNEKNQSIRFNNCQRHFKRWTFSLAIFFFFFPLITTVTTVTTAATMTAITTPNTTINNTSFSLITNTIFASAFAAESEDFLVNANQELQLLREHLKEKFQEAAKLYQQKASSLAYEELLKEINFLKTTIVQQEEKFRKDFLQDSNGDEEAYAFWDQGETTLSQLIMEYGSMDFLYIIPVELGSLKIQMFSGIPIPHESWEEMIEVILSHYGIGVKKLNVYLRQLYVLKHDPLAASFFASSEAELKMLQNSSLIFYLFSPPLQQLQTAQSFFERFSDPKQVTVQTVGTKIVLIATKENVEKLLQLYQAVWADQKQKMIRVVPVTKMNVQEAEQILKSFFQENANKARPSFYPSSAEELVLFKQNNSLIVIGQESLVERAEKILHEVEEQIEDPKEKTVFWYTCKHSDPEELAVILEKVYGSLSQEDWLESSKNLEGKTKPDFVGSSGDKSLPVETKFSEPGKIQKGKTKNSSGNFIVDGKTGSILLVIKREDVEQIQALLKKIDVPKKMVQIDVLLVEKRENEHTKSGINLLKIGSAKNTRETALSFDNTPTSLKRGILEFILSRPKGILPAFDFVMNFLLAQENLHVNANPSVLAINQTPATISIVEELSINNGAVQIGSSAGVSVEQSYTRAQFGITIVMTPIIHNGNLDEDRGFITLHTNVTFDTTQASAQDRPPVTRRHVENEVRIADGETIILGGLRKKSNEDRREKIPFLGDIPGIGKLFGTTELNNSTTEMFIFITPKIIKDPVEDLQKAREEFLQKRAGDIPEFLQRMEEAKMKEKKKLFSSSIKALLDF